MEESSIELVKIIESKPLNSIYIIFAIIIIVIISILYSKHNYIQNNWEKLKCNPFLWPFKPKNTPSIENTMKNCIGGLIKNEIESEKQKLSSQMKDINTKSNKTSDNLSTLNSNHSQSKGMFTDLLTNLNNIFFNIILNIYKDSLKVNSIIHKFSGVVASLTYVTQGGTYSGTSFVNGPIYKAIKRITGACFHKHFELKLKNGIYKPIYKLKLGDVLENGSIITGKLKLKNINKEQFYTFKKNKNILITGSHLILNEKINKFIPVEEHNESIKTDKVDNIVYNIITNNHLIKIGNYTFWDYND